MVNGFLVSHAGPHYGEDAGESVAPGLGGVQGGREIR